MKMVFMILHYGDSSVTRRCVESIQALEKGTETDPETEIVVVDNDPASRYDAAAGDRIAPASEETAGEPSAEEGESGTGRKVRVVLLKESCGFSHANNLGYAWIRRHCRADAVIACNNDLIFRQQDFCRRLMRILQEEGAPDLLGPDILDAETGRHQNPLDTGCRTRAEAKRTIRRNRWMRRLLPLLYPLADQYLRRAEQGGGERENPAGELPFDAAEKPVVLCGACLVFGPGFLKRETELFMPETQFYYEEYILARRCERAGYRMRYRPELTVLHRSGTATQGRFRERKAYIEQKLQRTADACEVYLAMLDETEREAAP